MFPKLSPSHNYSNLSCSLFSAALSFLGQVELPQAKMSGC